MKWLSMIATFLVQIFADHRGEMIDPAKEMKEFIVKNAKKVLLSLTVAFALSSIFVSGLVLTITSLSFQYDQTMSFTLTTVVASGLGLMLVSLLGIGLLFYPTKAEDDQPVMEKVPTPPARALEEAVILLIHDFVKEREANREQMKERREANATHRFESSEQVPHHPAIEGRDKGSSHN